MLKTSSCKESISNMESNVNLCNWNKFGSSIHWRCLSNSENSEPKYSANEILLWSSDTIAMLLNGIPSSVSLFKGGRILIATLKLS